MKRFGGLHFCNGIFGALFVYDRLNMFVVHFWYHSKPPFPKIKTPLPTGTALKIMSGTRRIRSRLLANFFVATFGHGSGSRTFSGHRVTRSRAASFARHYGDAIRFSRPRGKSIPLSLAP
jgi:hypothetical protein